MPYALCGETMKIGVYICHCGINIAATIDIEKVTAFAQTLPHVAMARNYQYMCSDPGQDLIKNDIKNSGIDRVVVAACSPRMHENTYRKAVRSAGLNPYFFEMSNIREQCSWVHANKEEGTKKAMELIASAVAKVSLHEPLEENEVGVTPAVLVIGGGIAGIQASLDIAHSGFEVYLVEKSPAIGGHLSQLDRTFPNLEETSSILAPKMEEVANHPLIHLLTKSEVENVEGFVGNFKSTLQTNGNEKVLEHGIAIVATGASELKPNQYLYEKDPRVLTRLELDRKFIDRDSSLGKINSAAFILCVGSRIKERPYCSEVCCTHSVVSALKLKEINPEMDVFIVYRDMRTFGLFEDLYREARSQGIVFIRYDENKELKVAKDQNDLQILFTSYVLNREMEIRPDLLILATAVVPPKENPIANLFKVPVNKDGFFVEAHVKLRPIDFSTDGVFLCGLAHSPKAMDESIAQGLGAAARAVTLLSQKEMFGNAIVAFINPESCVGCQGCLKVCPYEAIRFLEDKKICEINEVICKGCGACAATCPSASAQLKRFTSRQIYVQIEKAMFA